jgi:hypothetical protein
MPALSCSLVVGLVVALHARGQCHHVTPAMAKLSNIRVRRSKKTSLQKTRWSFTMWRMGVPLEKKNIASFHWQPWVQPRMALFAREEATARRYRVLQFPLHVICRTCGFECVAHHNIRLCAAMLARAPLHVKKYKALT